MKIKEVKAKSIVVKSKIPSLDYVVNPYTGCQHGCIYCYAKFMKRFTDHHETWGEFVDVKVNAPELIDGSKYEGEVIQLSSVTDPYQPLEAKYRLTRKILGYLVESKAIIDVLTKSKLVTRDIDLLRQFTDIRVGVSVSTLKERFYKEIESKATPPPQRIKALKKIKRADIPTYVFVSPIFPEITDLEAVIETASPYADRLLFENLNLRSLNYREVMEFLKQHRRDLVPLYEEMFQAKKLHPYWDDLKSKIRELGATYGKETKIEFHHGGF